VRIANERAAQNEPAESGRRRGGDRDGYRTGEGFSTQYSHRNGSPKARFVDQRKTLQLSPKQADIDSHVVVKMLNFNRKVSVAPMMDWTD
jgi:hypothetical protein